MPKIKHSVIKKPCISVGTISTPAELAYLTGRKGESDIVEVRVDRLRSAGMKVSQIKDLLRKRQQPTLLTLRTMVEGGSYQWKSTERMLVFEELIPFCDAVDFEIKNMKYIRPLLQLARDTNKRVVLSAHSLERKLTKGKAERLVENFRAYRVDIYKMASLARSREDLMVLVGVLINYPQLRLGIMATGPMAQISRMVLPALGSKLVYGYIDEPAAPGQPSIGEIKAALSTFGVL
ncbi:MAG: type I 3-dehydroquinate dehydratase [Verrucomicrobiota bacterium]